MPSSRQALHRALRTASYEVLPFASTEQAVVAHVPKDVALSVTTTATRGLEPTLDLTERLTRQGYRAAPHLAARLVRDEAHLRDVVARLREAGVEAAFVIGGDAQVPVGAFPDALSLLESLDAMGRPFASVGIAGHPEGHGQVSDEMIMTALKAKAPHASHVVTQICFDAATLAAWSRRVAGSGVDLPVRVGIPGAVDRQKLVRICAGLGLGASARFLTTQQSMLWRFFVPGGYRPDRLVDRLAPEFATTDDGLAAFHVFTFNEVGRTEAWRQRWLERLELE